MEIIKIEEPEKSLVARVETVDPDELETQMKKETQRRVILTQFIKENLAEGTDFGHIHISKSCADSYACTRGMNPRHWSKPSLFKPGSEKFCSLLQLRAEFQKDEETISMIGKTGDVIAFICRLVHVRSGKMISEGRGACSPSEKQGNVNTAIKIAEKRAQIDAVLRLGFSDSFTQDLEDMPMEEPKKIEEKLPPAVITNDDRKKIRIGSILKELGHDTEKHTPEENRKMVHGLTKLTVESKNLDEIASRLGIILKEKQDEENANKNRSFNRK